MRPAARILFDECVGRPHVDALRGRLTTNVELVHISTYYREGVKDTEWIPRIAAEPGWVVVTADRGTHSKRDEKLPAICLAYGVTHVLLTKAIHHLTSLDKMIAIESVWTKIEALASEPSGRRYRLRLKPVAGSDELAVVLERVFPTTKRKKK